MNAERGKCDQARELGEQAHYFDDGSPRQSCAAAARRGSMRDGGQNLKVLRQRVVGRRYGRDQRLRGAQSYPGTGHQEPSKRTGDKSQ